jgi:hypothetical protein
LSYVCLMKKLLILLGLCALLVACDNGSTPGEGGSIQTHQFFPYTVGDEYVWQVESPDTIYTRTWTVASYQKLDSHIYQMHVSDEYWHDGLEIGPNDKGMFRDTTFYRVEGQSVFIRKRTSSELLTLDFGADFKPGSSAFTYLKDTTGVVVPAGTFAGKIMKSDQAHHVYAQGVGMIYSYFALTANRPIIIRLQSARVGGRRYP